VVRKLASLRRTTARWREAGDTIALVPTMGALHAGHLSLVDRARRRASRVIVSIFVNPAEFGPSEDFATYPRSFAADVAALATARADLVWAPAVADMYPDEFAVQVVPEGPAAVGLEDARRPHFFAGVATVVAKLLNQCRPEVALFGEKDYQQLRVVTAMARDLDLPVKIVGVPTVREPDGLAMASRNVYLKPDERAVAPVLYRVLTLCAEKIAAGRPRRSLPKAARRSSGPAFASIISKRGMPRPCAARSRAGRCACSPPPRWGRYASSIMWR
jgi:pantoate--beta-alanine ligase